jgi:DNA repair exonuclease SbcCD nuclease subunit
VLVNDIHLSDRPPASCTDTYVNDLFELLYQISILAQGQYARIILAGDVFHHKAPSRTSHGTVMRLIDWARDALVPVYAVVGNHDMQNDRVDSIGSTQPLGVVFASGAIQMLDGWIEDGGDDFVYGVPWQMSWDKASVGLALEDFLDEGSPLRSNSAHSLVVTHAPLYPPGQELKFENFPAADFAEAMGNHGTVHYGHVHEPHGIYTVDGVQFSNPGALSRGSLHEHNLKRTPSVAVWDSDTGAIQHVELRARPADEVFRLTEIAEVKAAKLDLNAFLSQVQRTSLEVTSTAAVLDHVRKSQDDYALIAVIEKLLTEAS